jgi:hyperosmotically inducible periplasmic protein
MSTLLRAAKVLVFPALLIMAGAAFGAPRSNVAVDSNVSAIESQVRHKLAMLPWYGVFDNLKYQVNGTEVVLTGQVVSEHDRTKYDAENEVKRIPGVTKVVNDIQVLPPSTFDNQIRRAEFRAIFSKSDLGRYTMGAIPQVHIIVSGGHVALEGTVMNQMDRDVAGIVANTVPGVFSVTNNLQIG